MKLLLGTLAVAAAVAESRVPGRSLWVRGGSTMSSSGSADYDLQCELVLRDVVAAAQTQINQYAEEIDSGSCVADFGERADAIYNKALETFSSKAPAAGSEAASTTVFDSKIESLEKAIDAPIRVLYMKQLLLLRDKALKRYKSSSRASEASDYEAMVAADQFFSKEAEASTRPHSDWDFAAERASLQTTMNEIAQAKKRLADTRLQAAKAQQDVLQVIQMQQSQIEQLKQAAYGTASPWNLGVAYRVPDTNINLSVGHQAGRTNVQLSCVPDDSAALLGPNGFTRGVGPGNLGVTVNLSV